MILFQIVLKDPDCPADAVLSDHFTNVSTENTLLNQSFVVNTNLIFYYSLSEMTIFITFSLCNLFLITPYYIFSKYWSE